MNLPAHGTASPDPSVASLLKQQTKQNRNNSIFAWLNPYAARRNHSRPPGGTYSPPGANALPAPLFSNHRLAEHTLPLGTTQYRDLCSCFYRRAISVGRQASH